MSRSDEIFCRCFWNVLSHRTWRMEISQELWQRPSCWVSFSDISVTGTGPRHMEGAATRDHPNQCDPGLLPPQERPWSCILSDDTAQFKFKIGVGRWGKYILKLWGKKSFFQEKNFWYFRDYLSCRPWVFWIKMQSSFFTSWFLFMSVLSMVLFQAALGFHLWSSPFCTFHFPLEESHSCGLGRSSPR